MSLSKRFSLIFKAKANKILDQAEDPRETLDYSYQKQLEMLQQVRRGLADVATSRKRVELQRDQLATSVEKLGTQAGQAVAEGRDDLAREALTRQAAARHQMDELAAQEATLHTQEQSLSEASERLQAKVEAFRTRKETIKATYTAAEAQTRIGEAVTGISEEMSDVGLAMQRAEDKTAQLQARAGAIDDLIASGVLEDATGEPGDDIQAELDRVSEHTDIEAQLAELKRTALTGPPTPSATTSTGHTDAKESA